MIHILLILSFLLEPFIWGYSACRLNRKYKRYSLILYVLFDFLMSMLEQYSDIVGITGQGFWSMFYFIYSTMFICLCFKDKLKKKLLHTGIMLIITLVSDIIVILVFSIVGINADLISGDGIINAVAMLLTKCVMFAIVKIVLVKDISISSDYIPVFFLIAVLEVPGVVNFKNNVIINGFYVVGYAVCQFVAGGILLYIKRINDRKRVELTKAMQKADSLEKRLKYKTLLLQTEIEQHQALKIKLESEKEEVNRSNTFEILENRQKVLIDKDKIMYIERINRKIVIIEQEKQHEINSSIKKLESELGDGYIKISQGILVNKKYIDKIENEAVYLINGIVLYASRDRAKKMKVR